MSNKFIHLFQNCIPVKGHKRSVIYDLQKLEYHLIPNALFEIIIESKNKPILQLKERYGPEHELIINEYIDFLLSNQLAILLDKEQLDKFPPVSLDWFYPGAISNAVLDLGDWCNSDLTKVISELHQIGCLNVQIRSFGNLSGDMILSIFQLFENTRITSIEAIFKYNASVDELTWQQKASQYTRIRNIQIHSCPPGHLIKSSPISNIFFYPYSLTSESDCGTICPQYFNVNFELFTEALNFNTCLNKKIAIDRNGLIKNCPSMSSSFGNVRDNSLLDVLKVENFKYLWSLKKDDILICKDCEFRYMCTDCRAYLSEPENINSKPLKCGYDPYHAEWTDWKKQNFALKASETYHFKE